MRLEDACELIADCPHTTAPDEGQGYPLVRTPNIGAGRLVFDNMHRVSEAVYKQRNKRATPRAGDLIYAREAMPGNVALLLPGQEVCLGQRTVLIRPNNAIVESAYLTYLLLSNECRNKLVGTANGATVLHVNIPAIRNFDITLPPLPIQRKIAKVLSAYDDLIENNTKRIRIFERMIELGYKAIAGVSRLKEKEVRLSSIIQIVRGLSYSSDEIERQEGVRLINLKNINAFGGFRADGTKWYSGKYKTEQIVGCGDLVMGVTDMTQDRRTVGSVALIPTTSETSVISADLIKIESKIDKIFLYAMFRFGGVSKYIALFANGANVLHLRPQCVLKVKVQLPPDEEIARYARFARPLVAEINSCNSQNALLARQRDLLLPRLMSGKLSMEGVG